MLPPVENEVLQNNPEFAALYSKLTCSILNPDGSTRNAPTTKGRPSVTEELHEYRLKAARQELLTHAICTANPQSLQTRPATAPSLTRRVRPQQQSTGSIAELPEPLLELLVLLPPLLTTSDDLSPESVALLLSSPPFSELPSHLPQLAALISTNLHASAVHLARIANPSTNPSYVHRSISSLPDHAASLATTIAERKTELARARLAAAAEVTSLLRGQSAVLAQLLHALEAKHGPVARSLEFRATEAALTAQRQEAEAETALWLARRNTYTPQATRALANYASHLRDARARLAEAVHSLRAELKAYGVTDEDAAAAPAGQGPVKGGKEQVMREMARVYRDMGRQVEEVRGDLDRLGRA